MPRALKSALIAGGYLPADRAELVDAELALKLMRRATRWYAVPGERRFAEVSRTAAAASAGRLDAERRAAGQGSAQPVHAAGGDALIRRMHAIVASCCSQLRAGADWGAIAAEYLHGEPPATALGEVEAEYFTKRVGG